MPCDHKFVDSHVCLKCGWVPPPNRAMREKLEALRLCGNEAHQHPITGRLAVWCKERWWYVMGGDAARPSLIAAKEQAPAPAPLVWPPAADH
jgi:hypothetical protein